MTQSKKHQIWVSDDFLKAVEELYHQHFKGSEKYLPKEYKPTKLFESLHNRKRQNAFINTGRAVGKTTAAINELIQKVFEPQDHIRYRTYGYVTYDYISAKMAYEKFIEEISSFKDEIECNKTQLTITINNLTKIIFGEYLNIYRMRGYRFDGLIVDDTKVIEFEEILAILYCHKQGWVIYLGTDTSIYSEYFSEQLNKDEWLVITSKEAKS